MKTKIIALVLVVVLILSASLVMAQRQRARAGQAGMAGPPEGDGWAMGPGIAERLKSQLNLTPAQTSQLQAIRTDFMNATATQRQQLKANMQQMVTLWTTDPPDATAIKNLADQMDTLRAQIRDAGIDHAVQALNVLTPDQRAKVRTWIQNNPRLAMGMGCGLCCGAGMGGGFPKGKGMRGPGMGGRGAAPASECPPTR